MLQNKTRWCELFLGAMFLSGGMILIFIRAMKLESRYLVDVFLGVTFLLLGSSFIWNKKKKVNE